MICNFTQKMVRKNPTFSQTILAKDTDSTLCRKLFEIFSRFYADVDLAKFTEDLKEKDHVILLRDSRWNIVVGFTTMKVYETDIDGKTCRVAFSGDTILEPEFWGSAALHKPIFIYLGSRLLRRPTEPFYWFLISKGYKTYIGVSRNMVDFWPRHDRPTPPQIGSLIEKLAIERYGDAWIPERGILRFTKPMGRLMDEVVPITSEMLKVPEIAHFQNLNPGHLDGDELCCLARIDAQSAALYLRRTLGLTSRKAKRA